jgi:peptidoglycan-associated lipoprotein
MVACNQAKLSDARSYYLSGAYHAASETYRKLYRQTPRDEQALRGVVAFEMAENYRALNQSARAAEAYSNAIRLGYPDTMMFLSYAQMLHREGKYQQALDAYTNFLTMKPNHPLAGITMACTPATSHVRAIAPKLRTSVTPSNTTISGFLPSSYSIGTISSNF